MVCGTLETGVTVEGVAACSLRASVSYRRGKAVSTVESLTESSCRPSHLTPTPQDRRSSSAAPASSAHTCSRELARGGARLVSLDIIDPERPVDAVEYLRGDVRKPLDVPGEFDLVYNLAAVHRTPGHPDAEYFDTNVAGATNVTDFCRERAIKTIVFSSSISTYGPGEGKKTEDSQLSPVSAYGRSKLQAEMIHRDWFAEAPDRR